MKRFLIPFIAALALPTAVNAEVIYLECKSSKENAKEFTLTINEDSSNSQVDYTNSGGSLIKGTLFASQDFFITKYSTGGIYLKYDVSRINGSYTLSMGSSQFPDQIPEKISETGLCKKAEKVKTLF